MNNNFKISINPFPSPLFVGVFPAGISFADRRVEVRGDYKAVAFLSYATLKLEIKKGCNPDLIEEITAKAKEIQDRRGERYPVDGCGHTVLLGEATYGPTKYLTCCCCGEGTTGRQWYNRDTGYGLCNKCAAWIRSRGKEDMKDNYGISGIHYEVI